jgi:hypothetical protein
MFDVQNGKTFSIQRERRFKIPGIQVQAELVLETQLTARILPGIIQVIMLTKSQSTDVLVFALEVAIRRNGVLLILIHDICGLHTISFV